MSNRRSLFWLALAVLLMAGVHLALSMRENGTSGLAGRSALVRGLPEKWTSITVERGGTNRVKLVKGRLWRLVEPYSSSADETAVMRLMDKLSTSSVEDFMSDAELLKLGRTRRDFLLEPPLVTVVLEGNGDRAEVGFGSLVPSKRSVYAQASGVDAVFVSPAEVLAAVDRPAGDFRRRTLFIAAPDEVSSFSIKRGAASFVDFVRHGEVWTKAGRQVSSQKVGDLLGSVMGAAAVDFVWPTGAADESKSASSALLAGYGLDSENAVTVSMKCIDGVDRWIAFGKPAKEGLVYALAQNGGAVVTVKSSLKDLAVSGGEAQSTKRLFPLDAGAVSSYSIDDGSATYSVARVAGGGWRLDAPVSAAADSAAAEAVLARVLALTGADAGSGNVRVAVSPGRESVTVARDRLTGDIGFESLRSREIIKVDPLLVKRLVVKKSGQSVPVSVVYDRDRKAWNVERSPVEGEADETAVARLVSALNPLVALKVVKLKVSDSEMREYGLDRPYATVAVDQERDDAVRRNIILGGKTEGGRFATLGSADAVFVVSAETVSVLVSELMKD